MARKDMKGENPIRVALLGGLGNQPLTWYMYQCY